jgi:hypothetical protein
MMRPVHWIVRTRAPTAVVLVRLLVGTVFVSEGIQKFVFPEALGVGRFIKIGIPAPAVVAPFVGCVETRRGPTGQCCSVLGSFSWSELADSL